jgi:hypothetical protein
MAWKGPVARGKQLAFDRGLGVVEIKRRHSWLAVSGAVGELDEMILKRVCPPPNGQLSHHNLHLIAPGQTVHPHGLARVQDLQWPGDI